MEILAKSCNSKLIFGVGFSGGNIVKRKALRNIKSMLFLVMLCYLSVIANGDRVFVLFF